MADKYKQPNEADMKSSSEIKHLIQVNVGENSNKYWIGYVLPNGDFYCEYGRVQNNKGDCRHDYYEFDDTHRSSSHLSKKIKEKLRKGYVEQKITAHGLSNGNGSSSTKKVANGDLKNIATNQIQGDPEVKKLVDFLVKVNAHQITSSTNITYDVVSGLFTTPLGTLVTNEAIDDARELLGDISEHVQNRDWNNYYFKKFLGDYLQLIPQDVGRTRGWHETFLAEDGALQQQNDILDSLAASLLTASTDTAPKSKNKKKGKDESVFNVSLKPVWKGTAFDRIKKKYNSDKGGHYDVKDYDVYAIWEMDIATVRTAFNADGKRLGNVKQLWHGSKASNLLSIFKGGLIIPPSSNSNVTGRMFSDGLYFSDQSTKAIRYATGGWGYSGNMSRVFMFLADVAMGKYYVPSGPRSSKPPVGYDSYFAKGSQSGVMNNEMIVFRTSQADLTHLIEFKKS